MKAMQDDKDIDLPPPTFEQCQGCEHYEELIGLINLTPEDEIPEGDCKECPYFESLMQYINKDFKLQRERPIGLPRIGKWPKMDMPIKEILKPDEAAIYSLYKLGYSQRVIARKEGVSLGFVNNKLREIHFKLVG